MKGGVLLGGGGGGGVVAKLYTVNSLITDITEIDSWSQSLPFQLFCQSFS